MINLCEYHKCTVSFNILNLMRLCISYKFVSCFLEFDFVRRIPVIVSYC